MVVQVVQDVLPGFRIKDPACRLIECSGGFCVNNCTNSLHVDYKGRSMNGLGAGDNAKLPSGADGEADFLVSRSAWRDPHDGDFNDNALTS